MKTNKQILKEIVNEIKNNPHNVSKLKIILKEAYKDGINLNTRLYKGRTIMHYAVKANTKGIISLLNRLGVNPNLCDDNFISPLHYSIIKDCYHAAEELIKIKADINIPGEFEQTPLHMAVTRGSLAFIKLLIKKGADVTLVDEKNLTALDYAKDEKNVQVIEYLEQIMKKTQNRKENF